MEGAKIHGENSIRQKNQALNYRRMSARIDAVSARVQTAVTTKQVLHCQRYLCLVVRVRIQPSIHLFIGSMNSV